MQVTHLRVFYFKVVTIFWRAYMSSDADFVRTAPMSATKSSLPKTKASGTRMLPEKSN